MLLTDSVPGSLEFSVYGYLEVTGFITTDDLKHESFGLSAPSINIKFWD